MPHVNFSILVIQLFRSVSTCPNRKNGLLLIQICNSPRESAHEACKQFAQQQIESCAGLSSRIPYHHNFFECFIALVSSAPFQTWYSRMIPCQLVPFFKDRLVAQAKPFPFHRQHQLLIRYEYRKRSALWNTKDLACETKLTVCKHKQSPLQTTMNLRYKGHSLNVFDNQLLHLLITRYFEQ